MSILVSARVFWTELPDLVYKDNNGKVVTVAKSTAKFVLLAISDSSDDFGGNSYNSFDTLATKTSLDKRSVQRVVRALVATGYIKSVGISRYGTNDYTIDIDKLGDPPKKRASTGRHKTSKNDHDALWDGMDSEADGVDSRASGVDSEADGVGPESTYPSIIRPIDIHNTNAKTAPAIQPPTEQTHNPDQQPPKPDNEKPGKRVRGGGKKVDKNAPLESLAVFGHNKLPMAEAFIEKAGQVYWPTNAQKTLWFMVLNDWERRGFSPDDVRAAVDEMRRQRLTIGSPRSLTTIMQNLASNKTYQADQTPIYHRSE